MRTSTTKNVIVSTNITSEGERGITEMREKNFCGEAPRQNEEKIRMGGCELRKKSIIKLTERAELPGHVLKMEEKEVENSRGHGIGARTSMKLGKRGKPIKGGEGGVATEKKTTR